MYLKSLYLRQFYLNQYFTMKRILYFLIFFLIISVSLQAQTQCTEDENGNFVTPIGTPCTNTIVTAVPFLRIVPDARSGAMGDAGIATSPDPNAMHFNASKLAFAEQELSLSATYSPWLRALGLTDVYLAYLSGYQKLGDDQAIGLSLRYFSLGDIAFTDDNGESLGNGRPNEFEFAGAYARKLSENLSAGLSLKFIYSNLAADQTVEGREIRAGIGGAADISFTYNNDYDGGKFVAGLVFSNLGTKISYTEDNNDYLPANLGIGAAWTFDLDDFNSITIAGDINKLLVPTPPHTFIDEDPGPDGRADYKQIPVVSSWFKSFGDAPEGGSEELRELMYSLGIEYWYDNQFAVRAGYFYENPLKGNRKYFTVGLGVKYNIFGLNLSYLVPTSNQRNPLDNTLRFSLVFDFDKSANGAIDE
jgi:hypothetical protein